MSIYLDIMGNPLEVGDKVVFTRYTKCSSLFQGKIAKETEKCFIVQEAHKLGTFPWSDQEEYVVNYDRKVLKEYTSFDLLKIS